MIKDEQTGLFFDYRNKRDVINRKDLVMLPGGRTETQAAFWNRNEKHCADTFITPAREIVVQLDAMDTAVERKALATALGQALVEEYRIAVSVALHAPKNNNNYHTHLLMRACEVREDGSLGLKVNGLDPFWCEEHQVPNVSLFLKLTFAALMDQRVEARRVTLH